MRLRDRSGDQTQKLLKFDDDDDEIPPRIVHNLQGTGYVAVMKIAAFLLAALRAALGESKRGEGLAA